MKNQSLNPTTVILLVATMPLAAASLDIFLPALPSMVKEFGTDAATIQFSLSLNIIVGAISGFFSGILSDQRGRRKFFISSLFLFALGAYLCSLATNVMWFTIARTLQGVASGVIFVMVTTILSDVYSGVKKAQVLGIATFLFPVALGVAPFLGERIYSNFGWPAIFIFMSVILLAVSVVLYITLPETKVEQSSAISFDKIKDDMMAILIKPAFLVNALIPSVFMGAFMAFIAYSPFIYINYFGLTPESYVYYFIAPLLFQFVAGLIYQVVVKSFGLSKTLMCGMFLAALSGIMIVALLNDIIIPMQPLHIMTIMVCYNSAIPFVLPIVMAKAFDTFPSKAGTISSLASVIRNMSMASYIYVASFVFNATPVPILGILSFGIGLFVILSMMSLRITANDKQLNASAQD
jgi:DHA1 family bicyclomycin/chloramphenicol resistance-like MFS transporter